MIPARRLVEPLEPAAPFLKIWTEPADSAHTTTSRVRTETDEKDPYQAAAELARQFASNQISPQEAAAYARRPLADYWRNIVKPEKSARARNTLSNYANAVQLWERFEPPAGKRLGGMPISLINDGYAQAWCQAAALHVAPATVNSRWKQLRVILNHAQRNRVITRTPRPEPLSMGTRTTAIFAPDQIDSAYQALRNNVSLQVAFVLALNAGPRPVDLFLLHRDNIVWTGRPSITFTARKTGKAQTLPLADITLRHLARLPNPPESQGYLFGHLTDVNATDPERSRAARERNQEFAELLRIADIDFRKPWQAARATCNERLESHREGSGQFMLGHGSTLNSQSYREPSQLIYEAVNSVPQPDCFHHF